METVIAEYPNNVFVIENEDSIKIVRKWPAGTSKTFSSFNKEIGIDYVMNQASRISANI